MKKGMTWLDQPSGWVDAKGFEAAAASCDIRNKQNDRLDLALFVSSAPCTAAGVFTLNAVKAAPVRQCQAALASGKAIHAIVANSGNANACTGARGEQDAASMQAATAKALNVDLSSVLVCSTGRIGEFLPMAKIEQGIPTAATELDGKDSSGHAAADAILTSDTRRKVAALEVSVGSGSYRISAVAKGAGMIQPNMATMLAFVSTDAGLDTELLQSCLRKAVDQSFNAITVDGDMSTNDTVLLLANGASGVRIDAADSAAVAAFQEALNAICYDLAEKIVGDGEKITKVVELRILGAADDGDAEKVARAIGNSLLVKSSWYGEDPNWGRLLDAAGYAGARLEESKLKLHYRAAAGEEAVPVFVDGLGLAERKPDWKAIVRRKRFIIEMDLGIGQGAFRLLASDLTEGYVHFNKSE
ncbi:MAG: bifunctional glutamate N-acetyltransferase/amino-acid acetyltransferase ArgJ [Opitutales bacterium]|nr:bifunctional glutamate N-acetyltransferase/amino-acid acetyltransferase ArgJ [Opitutales bacterium]